ncbi:hypothetical protein R1sor_016910 [Riccia sorocarpa]|uniref:DNA-directed RNA polymerase subunit n=1 Tax=Riccia sorocarpa TaxID=122646 RepID=A0ABD3HI76_9MARC
MAFRDHDSLFCSLCGTGLSFTSASYATCPLCNSHRSVSDFEGKEIWCTSTAEDLIRRLGIEPLILPDSDVQGANEHGDVQQRAVVNDECPKCKNPQLEYYTRQLRSADEGQTVFYECAKCQYKFSQNM